MTKELIQRPRRMNHRIDSTTPILCQPLKLIATSKGYFCRLKT
jgi:hypothetical protein